jgi:hypothetical protein
LGLEFCDVSALQAQNKITGQSRQILFEGLPPQTQDLHGFFRAICPSPFISSAALRQRKKTDPQHGLCSCKSWPRRHEADGGQEDLDGRWVSLPSGSSRRRRNLQLQSMHSTIRPGPFFSSAALRRKKNSSATPPL